MKKFMVVSEWGDVRIAELDVVKETKERFYMDKSSARKIQGDFFYIQSWYYKEKVNLFDTLKEALDFASVKLSTRIASLEAEIIGLKDKRKDIERMYYEENSK